MPAVKKEGMIVASIVTSTRPHSNADRLEVALIAENEGSAAYQVVVPIDTYPVGQSVLHVRPDAIIPQSPNWSYLKTKMVEVEGVQMHQIGQTPVRDEMSQGIVLPFSLLPEGMSTQEWSDSLGVLKWQKPEAFDQAGERKSFPPELRKTDETNVQSVKFRAHMKAQLPKMRWCVTKKLDGTSATYAIFPDGSFRWFSRNMEMTGIEDTTYFPFVEEMTVILEQLSKMCPGGVAVQGEIVGPGINKNRGNYPKRSFRPFNIWSITHRKYFSQHLALPALCEIQTDSIYPVPNADLTMWQYDYEFDWESFDGKMDWFLERSKEFSTFNNERTEGLVWSWSINSPMGIFTEGSFKVINPNYQD